MGTVFKPQVTKPLPRGAEITTDRNGTRTAKWRNAQGKSCTAPVRTTPRGDCIVIESGKYLARFRDGGGAVRTVATGCGDLTAAKAKLAELVRRAELVKAGVISPSEEVVAENRSAPIAPLIASYVASLRASGSVDKHVHGVER